MNLDFTIVYIFSLNLALLSAKLYLLNILSRILIITDTPNTEKYLLVFKPIELSLFIFTSILTASQLFYIYSYFDDLSLYYFEYLAIIDEVFLTILTTYYIKTEVKNGK